MANIDIYENFDNYIESKKFRAFLYTPANNLVRELEMINPVLNLRKVGFSTLDFQLPAKIFDITNATLTANDMIDETLDGYEVEVWVGDLTNTNNYDTYRFIIKSKPSSMSDEKPTHSFSAVSSEWELSKVPIINWPGIERKAYKQTSEEYTSQTPTGTPLNSEPKLMDGSTGYEPIELTKTPKQGTITVTRAHTTYGVEIPLFPSSNGADILNDEYYLYESSGTWYIKAYVPANIKVPVDNSGTVQWHGTQGIDDDEYKYYIYYQTDDDVTSSDLTTTFEESPFYETDGLTINEIVEDLFANLQSTDSNMQHFLGWTFDSNSTAISTIRSGLTFSTTSVYDMLESLRENYQVYIQYNTTQRTVKILSSDFGTNNGLRFEYGKYLKGVNQDFNIDNQINYVQGKDANGVGFADVSWSGDNYLEDYTYFLDGVTHDGTTVSGLPSRWLSDELATELALRKYHQDSYRHEVWGGTVNSVTKEGIVKIRYDLQEDLVAKKLELEEIDIDIQRREALIEAYNNETDQQVKDNLDLTALDTAYEIPDKTVSEDELELDTNISVTPTDTTTTTLTSVTKTFTTRYVKTFTIVGSPDNTIVLSDKVGYTPKQYYELGAVITFRLNNINQFSKYFTIDELGKELVLPSAYQADSFVISGKITALQNLLTYEPFKIDKIILHYFNDTLTKKSWTTFVSRQIYLLNELRVKKNEKQLEINTIEIGPEYIANNSFNENNVINESNTYGIKQLEARLDKIRESTAINYDSSNQGLSTAAKTELKRIRRGQVYENTDIVDSRTLFQASEEFLTEKINPLITVSIESISILQAYEAQSDWNKVKIGEKVDIFVSELKINIEAEIVEISIDFQNFRTSLVIATTENYDRSFGKFFSDLFNSSRKTSETVRTTETGNKKASDLVSAKGTDIENLNSQINQQTGKRPIGVSAKITDGPEPIQGAVEIVSTEAYIDPRTEQLVSQPPSFPISGGGTFNLYGTVSASLAKITNGGLFIKDQNGDLDVALSRNGMFLGVADDANYLKWQNDALEIKGDLLLTNSVYTPKGVTTGSELIISNIDYSGVGTQFETDFGASPGLSVVTGSYVQGSATYGWVVLINYTGIATAVDTLPTASANLVGDVVYLTTDSNYYQCYQTSDSGYVTVTIGGTSAGQLAVQESNTATTEYRGLRTRFGHTFSSGRTVSFDLEFRWTDATTDFASKTVYLFYNKEDNTANIFDTILASTGLTSVVTSVNGQVGDVTISSTFNGGTITNPLTIETTTTDDTLLLETTEASSTAAPVLTFMRESSSPADGDYLGQLKFKARNDANQETVMARITGKISDVTDGTEDGLIEFANRKAGSSTITARLTSTDLKLINGTGLQVDGDVGIGTTAPTEKLEVNGDVLISGSGSTIGSSGSIANGSLKIGTGLGIDDNQIFFTSTAYINAGGPLGLGGGGNGVTNDIYINTSHNVGIGTTSVTSGYKLEVNGKVKASNGKLSTVKYTDASTSTTTEVDSVEFELDGSTLTITTT